jgi:siroheme synthase-like protein
MKETRSQKNMFPVSLLLEGRSCLLVGGGRVAPRKGRKLVEAGAVVSVVAPQVKETVRAIPGIHWVERPFEEKDLDGAFLVFALTDDTALNRRVVDLCQSKGILCSSSDKNWPDGDLILPASFQDSGLTVAVGTAGRACRRSRLLRESLSRHVEFLQNVDLFVLGADHNSGSFQGLENLKARRSEIEKILPCIQGVHEFMILDTCNRFEIIGLVSDNTHLETFLDDLPISVKGVDAFYQLAETVAGLRSQAFGETRIVAQIKKALRQAQENRWAGSFLQRWVDHALHISKEIRAAVEPQIPATETEDLVFQCLEERLPRIGKMLVVGRGEIGQGLLKQFPAAAQISGRDDNELCSHLPDADVVLCATGSSDFLVSENHRSLLKKGAVLIDLSLPRNIDPALPGVIGLSELRGAAQPENAKELLSIARKISEAHIEDYERLVNF